MMKIKHTQTQTIATKALTTLLAVVMLGSTMGVLSGCRGDRTDKPPRRFFPDMDYQPKLKPQSESEFFVDGRTSRPLVKGTVPFGTSTHDTANLTETPWATKIISDRAAMLKADESFYFGLVSGSQKTQTPQYLDRMPIDMNQALINRGQERFNIFCAMCHGYDGQGGNSCTVGKLWSIPPANLVTDPRFTDRTLDTAKDGYLFHIIREGLYTPDGTIRMPSYKHAVKEQDAWAIVAYLRVLQTAQNVDPSTLDAATLSQIGNPPPADPTANPATNPADSGGDQ
ncbi:MAG: cytochrome c [Phycisphaerales bacterium]|nr:cytochrome c [Phycisphaerales bacterium]